MIYKFEIPKRLPSFNEYMNINRYNKYAGAKIKRDEEMFIRTAIYEQLGNIKIEKPIIIHFTWVESNRKRDLDNIAFGKKFILDALVKSEIIPNDNPIYVRGFTDEFNYEQESRVIVEMEEV